METSAENMLFENIALYGPMILGGLIVLIVIALLISKRAKPEKPRQQPLPQKQEPFIQETARQEKEAIPLAQAPQPKKISLSKAIAAWVPLLKDKSTDREQWEEALIMSDMGPGLADELLDEMQKSEAEPMEFLKFKLKQVLAPSKALNQPWTQKKPWVLYMVGVNGVGKTTSLVKLATYLKAGGLNVGVVGADTFRKAAIEQLERGCHKQNIEVFSKKGGDDQSEGADPASVIFDGLTHFKDRDAILVDTSGRLHTNKNLMAELEKMKRVGSKVIEGAPHDVWLVLDSTLGQNAVNQAQIFDKSVKLTGLVLTKLDGLSKGGGIFQLYRDLQKPIWFVGRGEQPTDLEIFDPDEFVEELFETA